jgi:hypothetical protein
MNSLEVIIIIYVIIFILGTFYIYFNPSVIGQTDISLGQAFTAFVVLLVIGVIFGVIETVMEREENKTD